MHLPIDSSQFNDFASHEQRCIDDADLWQIADTRFEVDLIPTMLGVKDDLFLRKLLLTRDRAIEVLANLLHQASTGRFVAQGSRANVLILNEKIENLPRLAPGA